MEQGTNQLVGQDPKRIIAGFRRVANGPAPKGYLPELWDGKAAQRIAGIIVSGMTRGRRRELKTEN